MTIQTLETPGIGSMSENERAFIHVEDTYEEISAQAYARCIAASQRIRWDIDKDIIRGRNFDISQNYLPDELSKVHELESLTLREKTNGVRGLGSFQRRRTKTPRNVSPH
jgi:hypothetical protein